jgi:hypothetical protein
MRTLAGLAFLLFAAAAFAGDTGGIVQGVYFEAARGVMVDARMLRRPGAVRWVDVELANGRRALAQLPAHLEAKVGDEVIVQLGDPKNAQVASVLNTDRVIAVGPEARSAGVGR